MKLIDKSVDYTLAVLYRFWALLGRALGVQVPFIYETKFVCEKVYEDQPETQETIAQLTALNDELMQDNDLLREEVRDLSHQIGLFKAAEVGPNRPNNNRKLTEREVQEIREHSRMGWKNADLARAFDVNPATISRIVRGQYHKSRSLA
ncbi:helix-turn-helix domain-containing protein [Mycobacterium intracellulare]|uniref:Transposase IS30-like HTH domain-containing protein n=1 Tax=Mycobacterium intracellulare TaxID=1767 RepID=A0A7R7RRS7_MYCIT|nr:hypothetical protein [Mycobacterium intracellulare]BCP02542.1 hypothetical protein MINTM018_53110 [Mycobacterium intracellulare]